MSNNTDVPALSGAAVAGAVSIFMGGGSYGIISAITSMTLIFFLLTYALANADTKAKKLVFSMVFSLVTLPFLATINEAWLYLERSNYKFLNFTWLGGFGQEATTYVTDLYISVSWLCMTTVMFLFLLVFGKVRSQQK
ncbi:hypothetical protein ACET7O_20850 [Aeromonas veronii]